MASDTFVSKTMTTGPSAYESMMIDPLILNSTTMAIGPSASKAEATHAAQGMVAFDEEVNYRPWTIDVD